jgi:hypothetical protein
MIEIINAAIQVAMFGLLVGLIYAIVQVVDVIREEKERLMWYRQPKRPVLNDQDDYSEVAPDQDPKL